MKKIDLNWMDIRVKGNVLPVVLSVNQVINLHKRAAL